MKDAYSLDRDEEGLDEQYRTLHETYFRIFARCGLPAMAVGADVGIMGGSMSHEFMYLSPIGEDTVLICDACGYRANRQVAGFQKSLPEAEEQRPMEKISTPGTDTIEALARSLRISKSRTAKAVFMVATIEDVERFVFAVVRGDMELNETKLATAVGASELRPALPEEIRAIGAEPGYGSPLGVEGALVVADDAIVDSPNLVAGANEEGFHFMNVNHGRDFEADVVADLASAEDGSPCPDCGGAMRAERGVEVGNIFKLGTRYSEALGARFLDSDGERKPVVMGSYGIGVGRLLACIAEEHRDKDGLIWPVSVAPYHVHLVAAEAGEEADGLYEELRSSGVEVLYDDRRESLGAKFKDADLIGIPLRLTLTPRSLQRGGVEIKARGDAESHVVPIDDVVEVVQEQAGRPGTYHSKGPWAGRAWRTPSRFASFVHPTRGRSRAGPARSMRCDGGRAAIPDGPSTYRCSAAGMPIPTSDPTSFATGRSRSATARSGSTSPNRKSSSPASS